MKTDFHTHTVLSKHNILSKFGLVDGLNTPVEMVKYAKKIGLDCICITDHNYILPTRFATWLTKKYGILIVSGAEWNMGWKEYIALGIAEKVKGDTIEVVAENVKAENGILIAPHPQDPLNRGFSGATLKYFDAIEVINGFGSVFKEAKSATNVTGSDAHITFQMGYSYTDVESEPSLDDFLTAIEKGKCIPYGKPFPKSLLLKYYPIKYITWLTRNMATPTTGAGVGGRIP